MEEGVYGWEEGGAYVRFADEGLGTSRLDGTHHFGTLVHGDYKDGYGGAALVDLFGSGNAVHDGHGDVEEDDVRVEKKGFIDGFGTVGGFGDNLEVDVGFEKGAKTAADDFVIVGD